MRSIGFAALAVLSMGTLSACVPTAPTFDQNFGDSARVLNAQQVRNPEAPVANRDRRADGLDGRAAHSAYDRYQKSFTDPPQPTNVFTIGVGSGDSGGTR